MENENNVKESGKDSQKDQIKENIRKLLEKQEIPDYSLEALNNDNYGKLLLD